MTGRRAGVGVISVIGGCSALLALGCAPRAEPVARIEVESREVELPWPGRTEIEIGVELIAELPIDADSPRVFVHLKDEKGVLVRAFDRELAVDWWPGDATRVALAVEQSVLEEPLAPGWYRLTIGLYDGAFGRYAIEDARAGGVTTELEAARIRLLASEGSSAAVEVLDGWLSPSAAERGRPLGAGNHGARLLRSGEEGILRISGLPRGVRLFATLAIRGLDHEVAVVDLDRPETAQSLTIESECFAAPIVLSGEGVHSFESRTAAVGGDCTIHFQANYVRRTEAGDLAPVAELRSLAWNEAAP